jgi:D-alanyl-D-alanine carboxypeptidase
MTRIMIHALAILLLQVGLTGTAAAQGGPPGPIPMDDPRVGLAAGIVTPLLAADPEAAVAFLRNNAAPGADVSDLLDRLGRLAGDIGSAEESAIMASVGYPDGPGGVRLRDGLVVMVASAGDPPRITNLVVGRLGPSPGSGPAARFDTFDALDRHLSEEAANDRFSGVVLASRGDDVVFHRAYGQADREAGVPVRPDTRFDLGSIDKAFTGVAILRLAQEGRLGLDDAVGIHLAGLSKGLATATIRQLLEHRGGAGDYLAEPAFQSDLARYGTVAALLALIHDRDPNFEPGTREQYSNSGFVLLGGVVEALTGRPYHAVIREWVLEPAGMTDTGPEGRDRSPNTAVPYTRGQRGPEAPLVRSTFGTVPTPAGGGFSTAEDLRRFLRALAANRLLDEWHTDILVNEYAEPSTAGTRASYYGIMGGAPGINAAAGIEFARGHIVVVLTNLDPPAAESLGGVLLFNFPDS